MWALVSLAYERLGHADDSFAMRLPCVVFMYFDFVGQTWSRTNKQGNYLSKNYLFHSAVILPRRPHSQNCNLGGSEREGRGREPVLETHEPRSKTWLLKN